MMLMYHTSTEFPISVHPTRVEEMKRKGWTEKPTKAQPQPTDEVDDDGES